MLKALGLDLQVGPHGGADHLGAADVVPVRPLADRFPLVRAEVGGFAKQPARVDRRRAPARTDPGASAWLGHGPGW